MNQTDALYAIGMADHAWQHEAEWLRLNRPGTRHEIGEGLATLVMLSDARAAAHLTWIESMRKERKSNVRSITR
jgi:hypothetical protein